MIRHVVNVKPSRPRVLSVRISEAELSILNAAVVRTGTPLSDLVRMALMEFVERRIALEEGA